MYYCESCGWRGDDPISQRNGDALDPDTEWWDECPECFDDLLIWIDDDKTHDTIQNKVITLDET